MLDDMQFAQGASFAHGSAPVRLSANGGLLSHPLARRAGALRATTALHAANASAAMLNQPMKDGRTLLHAACQRGSTECAELLLAANASIDQPNADGATPLHSTAQHCT